MDVPISNTATHFIGNMMSKRSINKRILFHIPGQHWIVKFADAFLKKSPLMMPKIEISNMFYSARIWSDGTWDCFPLSEKEIKCSYADHLKLIVGIYLLFIYFYKIIVYYFCYQKCGYSYNQHFSRFVQDLRKMIDFEPFLCNVAEISICEEESLQFHLNCKILNQNLWCTIRSLISPYFSHYHVSEDQ